MWESDFSSSLQHQDSTWAVVGPLALTPVGQAMQGNFACGNLYGWYVLDTTEAHSP